MTELVLRCNPTIDGDVDIRRMHFPDRLLDPTEIEACVDLNYDEQLSFEQPVDNRSVGTLPAR